MARLFVVRRKSVSCSSSSNWRIWALTVGCEVVPTKIATETQLARLLGNTPIQVELELLMVKSHVAKNT